MILIPATDEHVQGTQSKGYFGLLQWPQGTGHLICLKVALSQGCSRHRLQILHISRLVHIVLRDLCSQTAVARPVLCILVSLSGSPMFNRWAGNLSTPSAFLCAYSHDFLTCIYGAIVELLTYMTEPNQ
jgi:hypothetical protein